MRSSKQALPDWKFEATCTEYRIGVGPELGTELRDHVRRTVEHDLWVGRVAVEFEQADRVRAYYASLPEQGERSKPVVPPDFWVSRVSDIATEWFKAHVQPQVEQRAVQSLLATVEQKIVSVKGVEQTVSYTARFVVQTVIRDEVTNGPLLAVKSFVTSPLKGVPALNGALQFATDWVGEPELSREQRIGRVLVAGAVATVVTVGVVALLPEEAVGAAVVVGGGLVANAAADLFLKPVLFDQLGLNAPKKDEHRDQQPAGAVLES